jgi:hypothetical protein
MDPHQDIIIAHKNGVETYVFQPIFCGVSKDFGGWRSTDNAI